MPILGAVGHQEKNSRRGDSLTERVQKPLRLTIDPVQVFKDQAQRLIQALAQEQLLERVKRPLSANLRIHLLQRRGLFFNAQQGKQIGQRVFQVAVQHEDFATHLFPPFPLINLRLNVEVALEQFDEGQVRRGLPVRDRVSFEDQAAALGSELKLIKEP